MPYETWRRNILVVDALTFRSAVSTRELVLSYVWQAIEMTIWIYEQ
jgi:hypothetical protein